MYTGVAEATKEYVANGGRLYYYLMFELNDGKNTQFGVYDDKIVQDSMEFQWDSCDGDFSLGGAVASQVKFELNNQTHYFDDYLQYLDGAEAFVCLRPGERVTVTSDGYTHEKIKFSSKVTDYIPCGYYKVQLNFNSYTSIEITGHDALYMYGQTDLLTFVNSLDTDDKFTFGKTRPYDVINKLKSWLGYSYFKGFMAIGDIQSDIEFTDVADTTYPDAYNFLLPTEFYADTSKITSYTPLKQLTANTKKETTDYDSSWVCDTSLWEGKTLLDFIRYFGQVFGMYVCIDYMAFSGGDANTLCFKKYLPKTTTPTEIKSKNIKDISFDYKEYAEILQNVYVKTSSSTIPFPVIRSYYSSPKYFNNEGYQYLLSTGNIFIPVSIDAFSYQIRRLIADKRAYLIVEDNPLIVIPSDSINRGFTPYNEIAEEISPNSLYLPAIDVYGGYRWINAFNTVKNISSMTKKLNIRNFSCTCTPQVDFHIGDYLRFYYDALDNTRYFDTLITHITFTPNVSMELTLSFSEDKLNVKSATDTNTNYYMAFDRPFEIMKLQAAKTLGGLYNSQQPNAFTYTRINLAKPIQVIGITTEEAELIKMTEFNASISLPSEYNGWRLKYSDYKIDDNYLSATLYAQK